MVQNFSQIPAFTALHRHVSGSSTTQSVSLNLNSWIDLSPGV